MSGLLEQDTAEPVGRSEAEKRRALWLETGAVLFVLAFPLVGWVVCLAGWGTDYLAYSSLASSTQYESPAAYHMYGMETIFTSPAMAPLVLFLIWRNGEPWAKLGLVRLKMEKEALIGLGLVLLIGFAMEAMATRLHPTRAWTWWHLFPASVSVPDGILLGLSSCAVGLSEELVYRGYLIPRFETLLGSTRTSVLLSTVVFGASHLPVGIGAAAGTCFIGILFAVVFCATRRIWPVAIAHSLWNFVVMTQTNAVLQ